MSNNTVVITETNGKYQLQNGGMSEFALIGILECILFDLKKAGRGEFSDESKETVAERPETTAPPNRIEKEAARISNAPELRTRIGNAVKAVQSLGGEAAESDLSNATGEELQAELESLTNQYKRLKSSRAESK